jgi:hypothetical protein
MPMVMALVGTFSLPPKSFEASRRVRSFRVTKPCTRVWRRTRLIKTNVTGTAYAQQLYINAAVAVYFLLVSKAVCGYIFFLQCTIGDVHVGHININMVEQVLFIKRT